MFIWMIIFILFALFNNNFLNLFCFLEFCVNMTCRGTKYGTAHMLIQINITSDINSAKDTTTLNLRRIKTCQKGILWMLHVKVRRIFTPLLSTTVDCREECFLDEVTYRTKCYLWIPGTNMHILLTELQMCHILEVGRMCWTIRAIFFGD